VLRQVVKQAALMVPPFRRLFVQRDTALRELANLKDHLEDRRSALQPTENPDDTMRDWDLPPGPYLAGASQRYCDNYPYLRRARWRGTGGVRRGRGGRRALGRRVPCRGDRVSFYPYGNGWNQRGPTARVQPAGGPLAPNHAPWRDNVSRGCGALPYRLAKPVLCDSLGISAHRDAKSLVRTSQLRGMGLLGNATILPSKLVGHTNHIEVDRK